jgi:DNA polymerase-1
MNVQNIPRDDKSIKTAFQPKLDGFLLFDFPNIELKMLAWYMEKIGHPSMAEVFRQGADLHKRTAAGLFGVPEEKVTDAQRQTAKKVNFSIVYGGGVPTLIEQGVVKDGKEAMALLKRYHSTWPGIGWQTRRSPAKVGTLAWKIDQQIKTRETPDEPGYIETLWGRPLHPHSEHVRINCLCQGCSADLLKYSLVQVHKFCTENGLRSHLVNNVHDEVMIDFDRKELPLLLHEVPTLMNYLPIGAVVPIRPEPDISFTTWADKVPYTEEALAA